jgi:hypothetical protein
MDLQYFRCTHGQGSECRIRELCSQIAKEYDPQEFLGLVQQLNLILSQQSVSSIGNPSESKGP